MPNAPRTSLRRQAVNVFMLAAFALVAASIAVAFGAILAMDVFLLAGIIGGLAGWRMIVIARRRDR
jgi:hypothetical protein